MLFLFGFSDPLIPADQLGVISYQPITASNVSGDKK